VRPEFSTNEHFAEFLIFRKIHNEGSPMNFTSRDEFSISAECGSLSLTIVLGGSAVPPPAEIIPRWLSSRLKDKPTLSLAM
jgi:hypothetical protein